MTQLLPNRTWGTGKRAHPKKFHLSGPPRALEDERDLRGIGGGQRMQALSLMARDERKFLGSKDTPVPELPEPTLPDDHKIPDRRPALWYAGKAGQYALNHQYEFAYWYYMRAASVQKNRGHERDRWIQSAKSCQKTWAEKRGITRYN